MKHTLIATLFFTALGLGSAFASDDCNVPMAEWQPREALQMKLESEGWKVTRIKEDDGCYKVYGANTEGRRVEAYFDPKTFSLKKMESED
jgi:hypothetical protein